ncbi:hypothetical protein CO173_00570 [Candidatus Uhrbacteria bacterium CG_4_9_14_3_um_filter_41_35]|uniref:Cytochrome b5 heme-binding domain-containing protein n=1 Tax=Candidatus Uhrbacteria bacterium CG_4_9_14_3_um_filter_41_35 TaxID=1975034 RepID=A0A2M7XGH4_9BACT|nr:MAG: hypothetical protein COV92_03375 [Candidatus Uhrbacteria bacterium CG11_big_fil_rev_8_21_14_0_20_41_9]PJA46978.1 MAG: hypothetical protein CO173_00570 [Candidatus Uhrbacteria bacterium CG_4_9_14_3_um_filter_41_35]
MNVKFPVTLTIISLSSFFVGIGLVALLQTGNQDVNQPSQLANTAQTTATSTPQVNTVISPVVATTTVASNVPQTPTPVPTPTPAPTPPPTLTPTPPAPTPAPVKVGYTASEVSKHNMNGNCWMIIKNQVYDLSHYSKQHPGGVRAITNECGKEASVIFSRVHSNSAWNLLANYKIGPLTN